MYTFVLEWTPALTPSHDPLYHDTSEHVGHHHTLSAQTPLDSADDIDDDGHRGAIPHGIIFAAFMVLTLAFFNPLTPTVAIWVQLLFQTRPG